MDDGIDHIITELEADFAPIVSIKLPGQPGATAVVMQSYTTRFRSVIEVMIGYLSGMPLQEGRVLAARAFGKVLHHVSKVMKEQAAHNEKAQTKLLTKKKRKR
jgi:hypothetical protein